MGWAGLLIKVLLGYNRQNNYMVEVFVTCVVTWKRIRNLVIPN